MGALETFRRGELGREDPLNWHPLNHTMAKELRKRREKGKESPKVERAARNRIRQQQFLQDLHKFQFDRALGHVFDGTASEEDIDYVARNVNMYEHTTEQFRIERSNGNGEERITPVAITVVDFTRSPKEPLH